MGAGKKIRVPTHDTGMTSLRKGIPILLFHTSAVWAKPEGLISFIGPMWDHVGHQRESPYGQTRPLHPTITCIPSPLLECEQREGTSWTQAGQVLQIFGHTVTFSSFSSFSITHPQSQKFKKCFQEDNHQMWKGKSAIEAQQKCFPPWMTQRKTTTM
jgi:hypothetical protein